MDSIVSGFALLFFMWVAVLVLKNNQKKIFMQNKAIAEALKIDTSDKSIWEISE